MSIIPMIAFEEENFPYFFVDYALEDPKIPFIDKHLDRFARKQGIDDSKKKVKGLSYEEWNQRRQYFLAQYYQAGFIRRFFMDPTGKHYRQAIQVDAYFQCRKALQSLLDPINGDPEKSDNKRMEQPPTLREAYYYFIGTLKRPREWKEKQCRLHACYRDALKDPDLPASRKSGLSQWISRIFKRPKKMKETMLTSSVDSSGDKLQPLRELLALKKAEFIRAIPDHQDNLDGYKGRFLNEVAYLNAEINQMRDDSIKGIEETLADWGKEIAKLVEISIGPEGSDTFKKIRRYHKWSGAQLDETKENFEKYAAEPEKIKALYINTSRALHGAAFSSLCFMPLKTQGFIEEIIRDKHQIFGHLNTAFKKWMGKNPINISLSQEQEKLPKFKHDLEAAYYLFDGYMTSEMDYWRSLIENPQLLDEDREGKMSHVESSCIKFKTFYQEHKEWPSVERNYDEVLGFIKHYQATYSIIINYKKKVEKDILRRMKTHFPALGKEKKDLTREKQECIEKLDFLTLQTTTREIDQAIRQLSKDDSTTVQYNASFCADIFKQLQVLQKFYKQNLEDIYKDRCKKDLPPPEEQTTRTPLFTKTHSLNPEESYFFNCVDLELSRFFLFTLESRDVLLQAIKRHRREDGDIKAWKEAALNDEAFKKVKEEVNASYKSLATRYHPDKVLIKVYPHYCKIITDYRKAIKKEPETPTEPPEKLKVMTEYFFQKITKFKKELWDGDIDPNQTQFINVHINALQENDDGIAFEKHEKASEAFIADLQSTIKGDEKILQDYLRVGKREQEVQRKEEKIQRREEETRRREEETRRREEETRRREEESRRMKEETRRMEEETRRMKEENQRMEENNRRMEENNRRMEENNRRKEAELKEKEEKLNRLEEDKLEKKEPVNASSVWSNSDKESSTLFQQEPIIKGEKESVPKKNSSLGFNHDYGSED